MTRDAMKRCLVVWVVAIALVGLVVALPMGAQAGKPTPKPRQVNSYAWSYLNSPIWGAYVSGVRADLLVTNPTPYSGSVVANFVNIDFDDGAWMQTGWAKGLTNGGDTGPTPQFYVEVCLTVYIRYCQPAYPQFYYFALLGVASPGTRHTFDVFYNIGTLNTWFAAIDSVASKIQQFKYSYGVPSAQVESHNTGDRMPLGDVSNLQFCIAGGRMFRCYPWDGYGSTGADSPIVQTILSLAEWTYSEN